MVSKRFLGWSFLFVICIGCGQRSTDDYAVASPNDPPDDVHHLPIEIESPLNFTAEQWHSIFREDPLCAKSQYQNQPLRITGRVRNVKLDPEKSVAYLYLAIESDFLGLRCRLPDTTIWRSVTPGSDVTVLAKLEPNGIEPGELTHCQVIVASPNPARTLTVEELFQETAKDIRLARREYAEQWVYLDGEVLQVDADSPAGRVIVFRGPNGQKVECLISPDAQNNLAAVQAGQRVTVFGQVTLVPNSPISISQALIQPQS